MEVAAPPVVAPTRGLPAPRTVRSNIAWIDNLRITIIAGVIVMHAATAYVVDVDWYYTERTTSELWETALSFPAIIGAVFGLGPLFLLAGMFSQRSLAKRGPQSFAAGRLRRLGVPLTAYVLIIGPLASYFGDRGMGRPVPLWQSLQEDIAAPDLGPTWFIAALLCFTLAFAAWAALRGAGPHLVGGSLVRVGAAVALLIGVASFAMRLWIPLGEDAAYNLTLAEWPQAAGLFALGVAVEQHRWLAAVGRSEQRSAFAAVGGLVAWTALAAWHVAAGDLDPFVGGWHWQAGVSAALEGLTAVGVSLAVVAWFRRRWDSAGAIARRAGRGDYAAYLLHPLVLVLLSMLARPLPAAPEVKFVLVASVGVVATFAAGYAVSVTAALRRVR